MKILFVSMPSIHAIRWIENLRDEGFELYWFDILSRGKLDTMPEVKQFTGWKKRKLPHIPGEYFLSKKFARVHDKIKGFFEVTKAEGFEQAIREIKPDVVHSFEMQFCSYPIAPVMEKYPEIKWIYSCWGSDLYHFRTIPEHNRRIRRVLPRVDYLVTDCERDHMIAKELGFTGTHLGVIPGGGGYDLEKAEQLKKPQNQRNTIAVKGYEHGFGRAINVLKALQRLELAQAVSGYEIVIFGAHDSVADYANQNRLACTVYKRHELSHLKLLELMGKAAISIGNSISDGIPNTLLEAVVMGAFPIQTNPGGVTQEIISDGVNGLLISDAEDIAAIAAVIQRALDNPELFAKAAGINAQIARERLDSETNRKKVIAIYKHGIR